MPRKPRRSAGGIVYHVLNRAAGRRRIFLRDGDYAAFLRCLVEAKQAVPGVRVIAWCVMPTHWHLVLWPRADGELSAFARRLTQAHAQRWRVAHHTVGDGPLYQGRFKSFPVQTGGRRGPDPDRHFLVLCRYVERNALRAGLARRAAAWRWGSAFAHASPDAPDELRALLHEPWPVDRPADWEALLDEPQTAAEEAAVQESIRRGRPLGDPAWADRAAARLGLGHTLRRPGRPPKRRDAAADAAPRRPRALVKRAL